MALLRGEGSHRPSSTAVGAHKDPQRGVEDSPLCAFVATAAVVRLWPSSSKAPPPRGTPRASPSGSFHSRARILSVEELAMINSRVLPPSCKDLVSTSAHLTPSLRVS